MSETPDEFADRVNKHVAELESRIAELEAENAELREWRDRWQALSEMLQDMLEIGERSRERVEWLRVYQRDGGTGALEDSDE
jgi:hypothetical protein